MELYRITQEIYAGDLSGNGAKLFGGRWNSEGLPALYAASTRSLALLETLAHTPAKMLQVKVYMLLLVIELRKLPDGWDAPDIRPFTQKTGDSFLLAKKNLLIAVPSVLLPEENNFVLNPLHPDAKKIKIVHSRRIHFDKRVVVNL